MSDPSFLSIIIRQCSVVYNPGESIQLSANSVLLKYITRFMPKRTASSKKYTYASKFPILISLGKEAGITIEGYLYREGSTMLQTEEFFVPKINSMVYRTVKLKHPNGHYSGAYLMDTFDCPEEGPVNALKFTIGLTKGNYYYVVR